MNLNKNLKLSITIIAISLIQMATNASTAILSDICEQFPGTDAAVAQYLMTFPNFIVVIVSLMIALLIRKFSKRSLAFWGMILCVIAGIGSFIFHGSLLLLFMWAGILGIGIGIAIPIANSLVADYFTGKQKDFLLGVQTAGANIGSMIMTFTGGILAGVNWYYDYLVYLIAIPGAILAIKYIPKTNIIQETEKVIHTQQKKVRYIIPYFIIAGLFMLIFYVGPTNFSLLVNEQQLGNHIVAATASTCLLFGGTIMGIIFGKISELVGKYTIPLGFACLVIGYFTIAVFNNLSALYIGSFVIGISNTLVLPQCMRCVIVNDKRKSTLYMSLVLAIANLGTFLTPIFSKFSIFVMKFDSVNGRFFFASIAAFCLAIISALFIFITKKEYKI